MYNVLIILLVGVFIVILVLIYIWLVFQFYIISLIFLNRINIKNRFIV